MDGNSFYEDGFSSLVTHLDFNVFGANEMWRQASVSSET